MGRPLEDLEQYLRVYNKFAPAYKALLYTLCEVYERPITSVYQHNMWLNDARQEGLITAGEAEMLYIK